MPWVSSAYAGAGFGRNSSIRRRISRNRFLGTATSANWNVTYLPWATTFACRLEHARGPSLSLVVVWERPINAAKPHMCERLNGSDRIGRSAVWGVAGSGTRRHPAIGSPEAIDVQGLFDHASDPEAFADEGRSPLPRLRRPVRVVENKENTRR